MNRQEAGVRRQEAGVRRQEAGVRRQEAGVRRQEAGVRRQQILCFTDKVIPLVKEWQQRPLESLYCIVWLDAMYYKVKEEGRTQTRCVYNILGINAEGRKDVLGMYVSHNEGANFWLGVINDLRQRGVADILIA